MIKHLSIALIIIFIAITIMGCNRDLQPKTNPNPKFFVKISGNIKPKMRHPITIMYKATYAAYNKKCDRNISWLEGIKGMSEHSDYYPAQPDIQGNYKIKIPIDRYLPGKCNWKISWITHSFMKKIPQKKFWHRDRLEGDTIRFGNIKNPQELPVYPIKTKATLYCGKGGLEKCTGSTIQGGYTKYVPRNKQYKFIQDITNKRKNHGGKNHNEIITSIYTKNP